MCSRPAQVSRSHAQAPCGSTRETSLSRPCCPCPPSPQVVVMDIRFPTLPVAELQRHQACVNALAWAPHSSCHICTAGDDSQALIWDLSSMSQPLDQGLGKCPTSRFNATFNHLFDSTAIALEGYASISSSVKSISLYPDSKASIPLHTCLMHYTCGTAIAAAFEHVLCIWRGRAVHP